MFEKKWLVLPICHEEHWSVCVIGNARLVIEQCKKQIEDRKNQTKEDQEMHSEYGDESYAS